VDGFVLFMFVTWGQMGLWSFTGDALPCNCTLHADGQQRFDMEADFRDGGGGERMTGCL
jgi:hypothetical protein